MPRINTRLFDSLIESLLFTVNLQRSLNAKNNFFMTTIDNWLAGHHVSPGLLLTHNTTWHPVHTVFLALQL